MKNRKHPQNTDTPHQDKPFFSKVGNQPAVEAKAEDGFFQRKLSFGKTGDRFEQEADKAADAVVDHQGSGSKAVHKKEMVQRKDEQEKNVQPSLELQRQTADKKDDEPLRKQAEKKEEAVQAQDKKEEEPIRKKADEKEEAVQAQPEKEEPVQAKADVRLKGGDVEKVQASSQSGQRNPAFAAMLKQRQGKGRPLPPKLRAEMESSFGADFSAVRIHTDSEAALLSKMIGAQAFTHGSEIFFNEGKFDPDSTAGKHLLAHELTHTRQQE